MNVAAWGRVLRQRDDLLPACITVAATLLFVALASHTLPTAIDSFFGSGRRLSPAAAASLILNIALILFAWTRQRDVRAAVEQRAAAEQRAQLFRCRDLDTELLNRGSLKEQGNELLERAHANGLRVALLVINIIRFKNVNEVHGEAVGDALLRTLAAIILNCAPKDALCARLGADEFAVAVPYDLDDEAAIASFAEQLVECLGLPIEIMDSSLDVSAAIGISGMDIDCSNFSHLLRRADLAMNAARDSGGKRPVWFEARMERAVRARNEVEIGLRRGIRLGEFVPHYQPFVECGSGEIRGFEMLARWNHPVGGIVGPEVFIPVAEEIDLIGELSEALMRTAFEDAKRWDPALKLAVNISPRQLTDPWFAQKVIKILTETGFPAGRLEIEITESSLFKDLEVAKSLVTSLKNHGISLALDDFGTGYSSLAHLRALPFDRIKIDRSFVMSLNKDPESWTIVRTIVKIGEMMGVPVTAEGVESAAIELRLRELQCDLAQGWFFGKALPADATAKLLSDHGLLAVPAEWEPTRDGRHSKFVAPRRLAS